MLAVLDELGLNEFACSIPCLSAVGAGAILVETGDLLRFTAPRVVVKHADLAPQSGCRSPSPDVHPDRRGPGRAVSTALSIAGTVIIGH